MFKCLGLLQMFKENLCFQIIDPDGSRRLAPRLQVFNSWNHSPGFNSLENLKYQKNSSIKSTLLLTHFVGKSLIRRTAPRSISPGFEFLKSLSLATSTQGSTSTLHLKAHLANWDFLEFHDDYSFSLSKSLSLATSTQGSTSTLDWAHLIWQIEIFLNFTMKCKLLLFTGLAMICQ